MTFDEYVYTLTLGLGLGTILGWTLCMIRSSYRRGKML